MTRGCSLNFKKNTSSQHVVYKYCFKCQSKKNCTQHVVNLYFSRNSMNNLSSYCGLSASKMRPSEIDLPVSNWKIFITRIWRDFLFILFSGQDLLDDHRFTVDCVQPKCTELRRLVQKLEVMLGEKRRILHKFLDLIDGIEAANKWSTSALSHLSRQEDPRSSLTDEDVSF